MVVTVSVMVEPHPLFHHGNGYCPSVEQMEYTIGGIILVELAGPGGIEINGIGKNESRQGIDST